MNFDLLSVCGFIWVDLVVMGLGLGFNLSLLFCIALCCLLFGVVCDLGDWCFDSLLGFLLLIDLFTLCFCFATLFPMVCVTITLCCLFSGRLGALTFACCWLVDVLVVMFACLMAYCFDCYLFGYFLVDVYCLTLLVLLCCWVELLSFELSVVLVCVIVVFVAVLCM